MNTHEGDITAPQYEGNVIYRDQDGVLYNSRQLIKRYHSDGEAIVARTDNWKEYGFQYAPGFLRELIEAVQLAGATRHEPLVEEEE